MRRSYDFYRGGESEMVRSAKICRLKAGGAVDVSIRLEYFNTSSSKCLMDLLKRVEQSAAEATVLWYYEEDDEDMLEAGEDYDAIIDMPFRLIATAG